MEAVVKLISLLEKQGAVIKDLITVTEAEIRALAFGDQEGILDVVGRQERLTSVLVGLEKKRYAVQQVLEKELSLPEGCTLNELLKFLPAKFRGALEALNKRLERDVSLLLMLQSRLYLLLQHALTMEETVACILSRACLREGNSCLSRQLSFINQSV
ncbi:MAG: flagellar export chaperone FlgN [Bacillota bacterium]